MRLAEAGDHVGIPAFGVGIILVNEGDPPQTGFESGQEIGVRQIALHSKALLAFAVEEKYCGRPHGVKAVEPSRMFLDMSFNRKEILVDKLSGALVFVGFGIQPSTSASSRGCTEIEQNRPIFFFGCC
jgi:hypothetical protein